MTTRRFLLAGMAGAALTVMLGAGSATSVVAAGVAAQEQSRSDQGTARREMRAGNQLSLSEIEDRIVPRMKRGGAEYLGPSYDSTARAYRFKFIRNGRVSYVDVDARTGRIISRSR
ncbi:PepSY domain-containing protein [uncultured Erythrobacter sp.]|uniref:PepSY domain-containing protein n=1 Tax=uncultured Erythrobacter sp. TaxID=263913 RepID=UPI00260229C7|nr:PepSY domain-containing protein [uncultured Erythrobacter sp.]